MFLSTIDQHERSVQQHFRTAVNMDTRSWLELMGMGHYADAFEEAGITIEDVYNIANITNQEDCSPLFRLNLLVGRRVNFTDTECDRLHGARKRLNGDTHAKTLTRFSKSVSQLTQPI